MVKPPNPFHRLHCAAFAFRSANSVMTVPSGAVLLCAYCHGCGWTRVAHVVGPQEHRPGQFFWPVDR